MRWEVRSCTAFTRIINSHEHRFNHEVPISKQRKKQHMLSAAAAAAAAVHHSSDNTSVDDEQHKHERIKREKTRRHLTGGSRWRRQKRVENGVRWRGSAWVLFERNVNAGWGAAQ